MYAQKRYIIYSIVACKISREKLLLLSGRIELIYLIRAIDKRHYTSLDLLKRF